MKLIIEIVRLFHRNVHECLSHIFVRNILSIMLTNTRNDDIMHYLGGRGWDLEFLAGRHEKNSGNDFAAEAHIRVPVSPVKRTLTLMGRFPPSVRSIPTPLLPLPIPRPHPVTKLRLRYHPTHSVRTTTRSFSML